MTFFYTQTQADDIAYVWANHGIPEAYLLAADYADGQLGVSPDVVEWLRGAASINGNSGYFNDFVRGYSSDQFEARYGHAPDTSGPNSIQGASDAIATTILGQITTTGELPILSEIADDDAEPAATALFGGDAGGWAGNSMFLGLGTTRLCSPTFWKRPATPTTPWR